MKNFILIFLIATTKLGLSQDSTHFYAENLESEAKTINAWLEGKKKDLEDPKKDWAKTKADVLRYENKLRVAKKELEIYKKFKVAEPSELACSPQTPSIDLEQGILKNLPFDHQNGIGTCFANVGKNLLYAVTDGKVNASFLDMALQYADEDNGNQMHEINGGGSCSALRAIQKRGYCDRAKSPLENGEAIYDFGLSGKAASVEDQASTLEKLESFLKAKDGLRSKVSDISSTAGKAIGLVKNDPYIELPRPSLASKVFDKGPLYSYYANSSDALKKVRPHSELVKDIDRIKKEIDGELIKEISSNPNFNIKRTVSKVASPLFQKYKVPKETQDKILKIGKANEISNMDRDEFIRRVQRTLNFYKQIEGDEDSFTIKRFTDATCLNQDKDLYSFGKSLGDLMAHAKKMEIPLSEMLEDGRLRPNKEILQLAVAPKCLSPRNRKALDHNIVCSEVSTAGRSKKYGLPQEDFVHFRVLESLKNGMPLGNSYAASPTRHINTIVGIRYNSKSGGCEFKIRESMTASSSWEEAGPISKKMYQLTEISRP